MANWQDENISSILEYPFDFQRYMEEQLREINDLDERIFAKKVLIEGLGQIIQQTERKYKELEKRVYQEISIPDNAYETVSTIVRKPHYDPTNDTLFPVVPMDLSYEKTRAALSTDELVYAGTVFLRADRGTCKSFEERARFKAAIIAEGEEKICEALIRKAERYRDAVEQLYRMFQDNHILWQTVNIGYLDKFYDVYVRRKDLAEEAVLPEDIRVQYDEYEQLAKADMLPLWNIEQIAFDSMIWFVISQIQTQVSEYRCAGVAAGEELT